MSAAARAFDVTTPDDAARVVEFFNAFHDGFIRRFTLVSHDRHESRDVHVTTGRLDLELVFAHYNYDAGRPGPDQLIEARFTGIRDLAVAFTGQPADWPILSLQLEPAPASAADGAMLARLIQPRLVEGRRWERAEALSFRFGSATFREVGPAR